MTALTMSNPLSILDLSELPQNFLPPLPSSSPTPQSPSHQNLHASTASPNSRSTSAFNYRNNASLAPTPLDVWIAASHTHRQIHPHQSPQPTENPQSPPVRNPASNPNDFFSSFLQPTPRAQPHSQTPTTHVPLPENAPQPSVSEQTLQLQRPISINHVQSPTSNPCRTRDEPALSHQFPQQDRMIYTAPLRTSAFSETDPLTTPLVAPMFATRTDSLSAVARAKKSANQFTMSELARKRKASGLDPDPKRSRTTFSSKSSTDDDENLPEKISHQKYQKRLQKNRDSAFVSRIRRREYTRLLEESLAATEKEKDAAINGFHEMKRRLDIVSAELSAFKQAAASNLSAVRDSLFSHLSTTTSDTQPVRSGTVVTSMFMFTLLFGILLPDCVRQRFGLQRYSSYTNQQLQGGLSGVDSVKNSGIRSMFFGNTFSRGSHLANESRGKVWGQSGGTAYLDEQLRNTHKSCPNDAVNALRFASFDLLGSEHAEHFIKLAQPYLQGLSSKRIARLGHVFRYGNSTRFEQLVEIEALALEAKRQRPSESESLLEHITLQMENARL